MVSIHVQYRVYRYHLQGANTHVALVLSPVLEVGCRLVPQRVALREELAECLNQRHAQHLEEPHLVRA